MDLSDLLANAHYDLVAPILMEDEYDRMAAYLMERGVSYGSHEMRVVGYEAGRFIRVCSCGNDWPCPAVQSAVQAPATAAQLRTIFMDRGWSIHMDDVPEQSADPFVVLAQVLETK